MPELPWLFSGEALGALYLGYRLGELDASHSWFDELVAAATGSTDPRALSGYLRARSEHGDANWVEAVLDDWILEPQHAPLAFDAIARAPASGRELDRLATMITAGTLLPELLANLAWGAWARSLSAAELHLFLDLVLLDDSPAGVAAALEVLDQWLAEQGNEVPQALQELAWSLLERPDLDLDRGRQMSLYAWGRVARILLSYDPVRVARTVLKATERGTTSLSDERLGMLGDALEEQPRAVWEEVGEAVMQSQLVAFELQWWGRESAVLDRIDHRVLVDWVQQGGEDRAVQVARFVKPRR